MYSLIAVWVPVLIVALGAPIATLHIVGKGV